MKKILLILCLLLISCVSTNKASAHVLEGQGDQFHLLDAAYDKNEKFVYSATLNFDNSVNSQAGGLVFGAKENEYYFVFNVDRFENRVKLMYFEMVDGKYEVKTLYSDYYIGNNKMTKSEEAMVLPKVRENQSIEMKVIITPEGDDVFAEFYTDGIKRFIYGTDIDVINLKDESYEGGHLGYNTFQAKIDFQNVEIGKSDYSYYSEMYRQQYHFSQYKNWNNDPNGLVYYNGYYHLFFQHHPFSKTWGDMYWGHARSKDLVHWEQLPICLFPDINDGHGGWAWSGSARVYHRNENPEIDKWLTDGNDSALIGFYTRDGHASQDQVIIFSEDEGLTWEKKVVVPQSLVEPNRRISWRDPKVFPINNGEKDIWGMVVSNMEEQTVYFLQSEDMINWRPAGSFQIFRPECVDVVTLTADDGKTFTVMLFEGREYLVGHMRYDTAKQEIYFEKYDETDVRDFIVHGLNREELEQRKKLNEIGALKMDFAADSYATQTFYIDDSNCENYGKVIALSWFSGVPGAPESAESGIFQTVRDKWNGGGFTIPVELGLVNQNGEYILTQTPITLKDGLDNEAFDKKELVSVENQTYTSTSKNILEDVYTHQLEIKASFDNPNKESIEFKLNIGEDEYTTVGWNKEIGYYVDRTNTSDAGINFPNYPNYHVKYSHMKDTTTPNFYILSDSGSIEVFCDDFTVPFYVLTLPSVYSKKASLEVKGDVTINKLVVNEIGSVYDRGEAVSGEGVLYVNKENVRLDLDLTNETEILYYSTLTDKPEWEIVNGQNVVKIEQTERGAKVIALATGEAQIKLTCGPKEKIVTVKVETGTFESDITFVKEGKHGGDWFFTPNGLIGHQTSGDGFLLSTTSLKDCYYTAQFDLGTGAAAALVLRAKADMSDYIIVNYDKNSNIVKAWTPRKELVNVNAGSVNTSNITLTTILEGNNGTIILDGRIVATFKLTEEDSQEGFLGLNVCATEATFKAVTLQSLEFDYDGGDLVILGNVPQYINKITNVTLNNQNVDKSFIRVNGRNIVISKEYFTTLSKTGVYQFEIFGTASRILITVNVNTLTSVEFEDVSLVEKENLNVYIGNTTMSKVGVELTTEQYELKNYVLKINADLLKIGENKLLINEDEITVTVTTLGTDVIVAKPDNDNGCGGSVMVSFIGMVTLLGFALFIKKKRVM